jgi:hypothetical protein
VLRYLQATSNFGLVMDVQQGTGVRIDCYSDADFANDPTDRRSISGYVTTLDDNVISYASRKQEINAQSTCEAEYVAMAEATKDVLWLAGLCKELKWKHPVPLLLGDNQGAISLSVQPGKHSKTKQLPLGAAYGGAEAAHYASHRHGRHGGGHHDQSVGSGEVHSLSTGYEGAAIVSEDHTTTASTDATAATADMVNEAQASTTTTSSARKQRN